MSEACRKGLTEKQITNLSGMGAYSTHSNISYSEWQANRMIVKQNEPKRQVFIDWKK